MYYIFFTLDLDKVVANTSAISRVTHADPRCTASCVAMTTAVSSCIAYSCNKNVVVIQNCYYRLL